MKTYKIEDVVVDNLAGERFRLEGLDPIFTVEKGTCSGCCLNEYYQADCNPKDCINHHVIVAEGELVCPERIIGIPNAISGEEVQSDDVFIHFDTTELDLIQIAIVELRNSDFPFTSASMAFNEEQTYDHVIDKIEKYLEKS